MRNTPEETPIIVTAIIAMLMSFVAALTGSLLLAIFGLALMGVACAVLWTMLL